MRSGLEAAACGTVAERLIRINTVAELCSITHTRDGELVLMGTSERRIKLGVIRGDGIGPELVESALTVLSAVAEIEQIQIDVVDEPGGAKVYQETQQPLRDGALERLRETDGILKGPVGLPNVRRADGTEGGLLGGVLRTGLDTYANVRPIYLRSGVPSALGHSGKPIDYVIVRENTEGLYLSRGKGVSTANAAADQMLITRIGTERIVRAAFEIAMKRSGAPGDGVSRVTCVDKSNVLRSFAFFRSIFEEIAAEYPSVEAGYIYADAAAESLVMRPEQYDVLVMENFLGDILSDLGAGTIGGLGMCGSANLGDNAAYFEPVHGSAPDIAGKGKANPASQIISASMLLDHVGYSLAARRVQEALSRALEDGSIEISHWGQPKSGTAAAAQAVVHRLL